MRIAAAAVALALALVAASCGGGGPKVYENPHGTIGVKRGDVFTLRFVVNMSVGYEWQLIPFDIDSPKLQELGTNTRYPGGNRAGESGKRSFRFRATKVGRQVLIFQHFFRGKPQDRRVLRIDVKPAS